MASSGAGWWWWKPRLKRFFFFFFTQARSSCTRRAEERWAEERWAEKKTPTSPLHAVASRRRRWSRRHNLASLTVTTDFFKRIAHSQEGGNEGPLNTDTKSNTMSWQATALVPPNSFLQVSLHHVLMLSCGLPVHQGEDPRVSGSPGNTTHFPLNPHGMNKVAGSRAEIKRGAVRKTRKGTS